MKSVGGSTPASICLTLTKSKVNQVPIVDSLFSKGFHHFLTKQYFSKIQGNTSERIETLKLANKDIFRGNFLLSTFTDANQAQEFKTQFFPPKKPRWSRKVFLSVAGSGKTRRLLDVLSVNFGHYLVSGGVSSNEDPSQSLLNPHPGLASKDTKFLSEVMDNFQPPEWEPKIDLTERLWYALIRNRQMTLSFLNSRFADELGRSETRAFNPQDWLVFQTICTEKFDPFLETFKILLLMYFFYDRALPWCPFLSRILDDATSSLIPPERVIFCMDEMQSEIRDDVNVDQQPLTPFLRGLLHWEDTERTQIISTPNGISFQMEFFPFIGAGTSLNYLKTLEILSEKNEPSALDKISEPQMIVTADGFHDLVHRHIHKIIGRMGYLYHLGSATEEYSLWELLVPGDSGDDKRDSYRTIQRLLEMKLITSSSLKDAIHSLKTSLQTIICCSKEPNGDPNEQLRNVACP